MCFSAEASFVSGALIGGAALLYLKKSRLETGQKYLALIPFFFAIQQISEGFVWLGIDGYINESVSKLFIYLFSFFATSFWPAYIPFASYQFDKSVNQSSSFNPARLVIHYFLMVSGSLVASYLLWSSFFYSGIELKISCNQFDCNSIAYLFSTPFSGNWLNFVYLFLVLFPFAYNRDKAVRYVVAPCFFISFIAGALLSKSETFPSVWCFFAALMSTSIFFISLLRRQQHE